MPLPTFDTLDAIPESFRDLYEVQDGKPVPKDEAAPLKAALEKERTTAIDAKNQAKALEKRLAELEITAKAKSAGISDEQLATLRAEFDAKLAPERDRAEKAESALREMRLDGSVKSMMATKDVGVRAERIDTLWTLKRGEFDLTEKGAVVYKADPTADVGKVLAGFATEFPEFYVAPAVTGSGSQQSAAALRITSVMDTHEMFKQGLAGMKKAS